jgi:hypothetical protein
MAVEIHFTRAASPKVLGRPHARVGSLTEMKRKMSLPGIHLEGFQPLRFSWQPYCLKMQQWQVVLDSTRFNYLVPIAYRFLNPRM